MSKTKAGPIVADRLKSFIDRIERLEEEQAALASDKRDIYSEAKGVGYDIKTMRKVVALRKMDAADRAEQETLLDVYLHALGMVDRVEARVASGEPVTKAAKAEGVPRSTFYRVSQKRASVGNGTPTQTPEVQPAGTASGTGDVTTPQPAAVAIHDPKTGEINGGETQVPASARQKASDARQPDPAHAGRDQGHDAEAGDRRDDHREDGGGAGREGPPQDQLNASPQGGVDGPSGVLAPSDLDTVPPSVTTHAPDGANPTAAQPAPEGGEGTGTASMEVARASINKWRAAHGLDDPGPIPTFLDRRASA